LEFLINRPVFDVVARLLRGAQPPVSSERAVRGLEWQANASSNGSQNTLTMQVMAESWR